MMKEPTVNNPKWFTFIETGENKEDVFIIEGVAYRDYAELWYSLNENQIDIWIDGTTTGWLNHEQYYLLKDIKFDVEVSNMSVELALEANDNREY